MACSQGVRRGGLKEVGQITNATVYLYCAYFSIDSLSIDDMATGLGLHLPHLQDK